MKKTNKILLIVFIVIGISIFFLGGLYKSGAERKAWFRYASKYDKALSKMEASGGAISDYNRMKKEEQKFLQAKQPTETEIISVLRSPKRRFQRIGLAAMHIKPIETDQLIDILFEFLQDQNLVFRWYAVGSLGKFTKFPESKKADLGKQLLEIVKSRKDNELSIQEITLLANFPSEEATQFLTEQLMKEGIENYLSRLFAAKALKRMGDPYYDKASEYVKNHGSPEIKEELLERENSWIDISTERE